MSDVQVFGAARDRAAARDRVAAQDRAAAHDRAARDRVARTVPRPGCRELAAEPSPGVLRPRGLQDLRAGRGPGAAPGALHYPEGDLLVVSGLPGSGKSTLMRRCVRTPIVDSQLVREEYASRVPSWLPYALYRPLVRLAHYRRLRRAVLAGGSLTVHDCGAVPYVRQWLARTAERQGRRVHLILLDASAEEARDGQRARGQAVSAYAFARHRDAAHRLRRRLAGTGRPPAGCASAVVLDRAGARALREIVFAAS
ncbi:AAA family ATPase [Kitasatospora purpeofusca]|uniref:AAA family ATPase n=1 Tax=Kitasatospora purpeofusca TaxID=67352 RepID=UPI00386A833A|nr:ATP-binding protein [Kitasatospora purpeofusca]